MRRYKLKYNWGAFKGTGTVTVTRLETTETHKLRVGRRAELVGEYTKRTDVEDDEGETYSLVRSRRLIGTGNLLAGVLLDLLILAVQEAVEKKK